MGLAGHESTKVPTKKRRSSCGSFYSLQSTSKEKANRPCHWLYFSINCFYKFSARGKIDFWSTRSDQAIHAILHQPSRKRLVGCSLEDGSFRMDSWLREQNYQALDCMHHPNLRYHVYVIHICFMCIQVVPGRAGGGSFRRKKNYIAKKEFAYRMCARRPTSAMPKPCLCCERAFCCSMVVMWPVLMHVMSFDVVVMSFDAMWLLVLCHVTWCNAMSCDVPCNGHVACSKWFCDNAVIQSTILHYKVLLCTTKYYSSTTLYYTVLQRTTSVLLCTTKYYSSTTLYYKVLLQYYSVLHSTTTLLQYYPVLQSTTPVLLCTTQYYNVLLQYYSVLQSTTPVLLCTTKYYSSTTQYYNTTPVLPCTTKYYSSTTLYCKVLLQYYSVLQSTTPVLLSTTQYYNVLLQYYSVLQRTTPVLFCTTKQHSWLILDTYEYEPLFTWLMSVAYETSFTKRGATGVTLQLHQILRLPRKMNLMIDPPHIWNVI